MTDVGETEQGAAGGDATELERVRDLVLQAHPDVVPDLVRGDSLDALLASVEPARTAYQQIAERVRGTGDGRSTTAILTPPAVPAAEPKRVCFIGATDRLERAEHGERKGR